MDADKRRCPSVWRYGVSDLTSSPNYPNNPTGSGQLTSPEGLTNWADIYGTRIRGYIYPSATGSYTFWVARDDNTDNLTAGQKYYIEVLQKEGSGGDNVAVAWQGPGITQQVIAGNYLSPFIPGQVASTASQVKISNGHALSQNTEDAVSLYPNPSKDQFAAQDRGLHGADKIECR